MRAQRPRAAKVPLKARSELVSTSQLVLVYFQLSKNSAVGKGQAVITNLIVQFDLLTFLSEVRIVRSFFPTRTEFKPLRPRTLARFSPGHTLN
jgi:hypothetical protein